ncbi:GAF domain-containing protein [Petrimonas mucosa]|uniref:GAF domain-containing protein n=1 Tax=Petrimonas mucosa TaxID=1642646 RepID=UPI001756763D|nr:GAF domain-containing protein [Petrimonas mucosa]HHT30823.1 GAF domain-containing protein [Petrimonas mucosa]
MAEDLYIAEKGSLKEKYESLIPQLQALTEDEPDIVANMANVAAALKETFGFFWVGFYRVDGEQLVLGPFQGPVACTRIAYGKGVCGMAWKEGQTLLIPDVDQFPGHIACSSLSRSEIVVPAFKGDEVCAVLDVDSDRLDTFSETDAVYLQKIVSLLKF